MKTATMAWRVAWKMSNDEWQTFLCSDLTNAQRLVRKLTKLGRMNITIQPW